ncbi:hypothetical protein D3C87_2081030 [compost metagenome]
MPAGVLFEKTLVAVQPVDNAFGIIQAVDGENNLLFERLPGLRARRGHVRVIVGIVELLEIDADRK